MIGAFRNPLATRRRLRGDDGYVLLTVLGVVLLLTAIGVALLTLVLTSLRMAHVSEQRADSDRSADSALETALQKWRSDESLVGIPANGASPAVPAALCSTKQLVRDGLTITCANEGALNPERRVLNVSVKDGSGDFVGRARVRIFDEVNNVRSVGHSLEVCDWLIGANAKNLQLKGCA